MTTELTYGATRQKLIENGYVPTSALQPYGVVLGGIAPPRAHSTWSIAEHPAALLCHPGAFAKGRVAALIVMPESDAKLRAAIDAVLAQHGFSKGPRKMGSDGAIHHLLRVEDSEVNLGRVLSDRDPIVALEYAFRQADWFSAIIPLAGRWSGGDPLTVARDRLPAIDRTRADDLFAALGAVVAASRPPVSYQEPIPPTPSPYPVPPGFETRPRFAAPTSKHDFRGQESLIDAWRPLYDKLPDSPPEEARPTRGYAGVPQEELERRAAAEFASRHTVPAGS